MCFFSVSSSLYDQICTRLDKMEESTRQIIVVLKQMLGTFGLVPSVQIGSPTLALKPGPVPMPAPIQGPVPKPGLVQGPVPGPAPKPAPIQGHFSKIALVQGPVPGPAPNPIPVQGLVPGPAPRPGLVPIPVPIPWNELPSAQREVSAPVWSMQDKKDPALKHNVYVMYHSTRVS